MTSGALELAVFDRDCGLVTQTDRRAFADWYFGEVR
jgi:hypothetical protein